MAQFSNIHSQIEQILGSNVAKKVLIEFVSHNSCSAESLLDESL